MQKPVKWECDGSPELLSENLKKESRGTDIVLYINYGAKSFLSLKE